MKKFEIVIPLETYTEHSAFFDTVMDTHCSKWATNEHHQFTNDDGIVMAKFDHQHLGGWLHSDNTPETICKWFVNDFGFDVKENSIEKIKGQWATYCLYIGLHHNHDDKEQFTLDTTKFRASDTTKLCELISNTIKSAKNDTVLDKIATGELKEYQIIAEMGVSWYRTNYRQVETALKVYSKSLRNGGQTMKTIIWVYGSTGTGKTALATMCLNQNKDFYLACDRNPLDDYKGEPVLVLDDISDGTLTSKALLKLLDPNYTAPTSARYYNKMVTADTIIVTSTISPERWWQNNRQNEKNNGNYEQLLRRLNGGVFHILNDTSMELLVYNATGSDVLKMTVDIPKPVHDVVVGNAKVSLQDKANGILRMFEMTIHETTPKNAKQGSFVDEQGEFIKVPNDYKFGDDMD